MLKAANYKLQARIGRASEGLLFLFRYHSQVFFQGGYHGRRLWLGSFYIQCKPGIFHSFGSVVAKSPDLGTVLLEFGIIVKETFDTAGRKETDYIVFALIEDYLHIIADRTIHEWGGKSTIIMLQPVDDLVVLLIFGAGIKELLVLLMFVDDVEHAFVQSIRAIENFPLAVQYELLEIKGHSLRNTEILGILRHADLHLFTNTEKMIDSIPAGEDHSRELCNIDLLLPEILGRYGFQANERMESKLHLVLLGKLEIRRLVCLRSGLRD